MRPSRKFILDHTSAVKVLATPSEFDERLCSMPIAFLAQSLLTASFANAKVLVSRYPELLGQSVPILLPHLRDETLGNYTAPSGSFLLSCDFVPIPSALPLPDYILLVGSYRHCSELMRFLQSSRSALPVENARIGKSHLLGWSAPLQRTNPATLESGSDAAASSWRDHPLRPSEYDSLLVSLIKEDRNDRRDLWQVVTAQVDGGQPRKSHYVNLALFYANPRALEALFDNKWSVEGPKYFPIASPRSLALKLQAFYPRLVLPTRREAGFKMSGLYGEFDEWFEAKFSFQEGSLDMCLEVIMRYNATISQVLAGSRVFMVSFRPFHHLHRPSPTCSYALGEYREARC